MELSLRSKIDALDENEKPEVFLMKLEGLVAGEIENGKLKTLKEIKRQREFFECVCCGNDFQINLYSVMRAVISIARYDEPVCAECERDFYLEKTRGMYGVSNQKHREVVLNVLDVLQKY